jgi:hypothetical protein
VLGLLSAHAGHGSLLCLIDDQQWLDRASAQVLGFLARRLKAERLGLVFAVRELGSDLAGLPELEVGGLPEDDARVLLDSALTAPLDARVRELIVAESRGNPLALLELPRGLGPAELAGGFGLPSAWPLASWIEDSFARHSTRSRPAPGSCCGWPRPTSPGTQHWSGGRPGSSASRSAPRPRRRKRGWRRSAPRSSSGIRWPAWLPTARRRWPTGSSCTRCWPRRPIRWRILIAGPGI